MNVPSVAEHDIGQVGICPARFNPLHVLLFILVRLENEHSDSH